jgi:heptaprenyl diphosphate synthase
MPASFWSKTSFLQAELSALESLLKSEFRGGGIVEDEAARIMLGGGKRIRPALVIASACAGEYDRKKALPLAAAIEALHAAALVHDDVIDGARTRRGMPAAHVRRGNHAAIYIGDCLLARAMMLLSQSGLPGEGMRKLSKAMKAMCAGEVAQYAGRFRMPGFREYLKRIIGKTGMLFAAACEAGGLAGGLGGRETTRLARFGMRLGAAFQMRDDILDIEGGDGKPAGQDLSGGIVTLPVMLAAAERGFRAKLAAFLEKRRGEDAKALLEEARRAGAPQKAREFLLDELEKAAAALLALPETPGRAMLMEITNILY